MFPSLSRAKRSFCDAQIWVNFAGASLEVASPCESSSRYSLTFIDTLGARSWASISPPVLRSDPTHPALRAKLIEAPTAELEVTPGWSHLPGLTCPRRSRRQS